MLRKHPTLFSFLACVLAMVGAMAWITHHLLSLERAEHEARARATLQEAVRLALWRMDTAAGTMLARESARPYFEYRAFYAAERAYTRMWEELQTGEVLVASPLLTFEDPWIQLHFERCPGGAMISPQAPSGAMRNLAESSYVSAERVGRFEDRLKRLTAIVDQVAQHEGALGYRYRTGTGRYAHLVEAPAHDPSLQVADAQRQGGQARQQWYAPRQNDFAARANNVRDAAAQVQNLAVASQSGASPHAISERTSTGLPSAAPTDRSGASAFRAEVRQADDEDQARKVSVGAAASNSADKADETRSTALPPKEQSPTSPAREYKQESIATGAPAPPAPAAESANRELSKDGAPAVRREDNASAVTPEADKRLEKSKVLADRAEHERAASPSSMPGNPPPSAPAGTGGGQSTGGESRSAERIALESGIQLDAFNDPTLDPSEQLSRALGFDGPLWCGIQMGDDPSQPVEVGPLFARWVRTKYAEPELVYIRPVTAGGTWTEQGFWVSWPAMRESLLTRVRDLLPNAALRVAPAGEIVPEKADLRLAAVPAELDPGATFTPPPTRWSRTKTTLAVAWGGLLIGMGAIAVLLTGANRLAERRGRFVSVVTHELRTPLTTFCMYSQMLADGMVPPGEGQKEYLGTLKRESNRLAGIVENVLAYARLGRGAPNGKARPQRDATTLGELIRRVRPSLEQRSAACGMTLTIDGDDLDETPISTSVPTIERIVMNLVENACKYANVDGHGRVDVRFAVEQGQLIVSVRDHGPGIPPQDEPRIFKPFERGSNHQDGHTPGLGLGLSLSRGLARELKGDLKLVRGVPAEFELRVPVAE